MKLIYKLSLAVLAVSLVGCTEDEILESSTTSGYYSSQTVANNGGYYGSAPSAAPAGSYTSNSSVQAVPSVPATPGGYSSSQRTANAGYSSSQKAPSGYSSSQQKPVVKQPANDNQTQASASGYTGTSNGYRGPANPGGYTSSN